MTERPDQLPPGAERSGDPDPGPRRDQRSAPAGLPDPSKDPPRPLPVRQLTIALGILLILQSTVPYLLGAWFEWTPATAKGVVVGGWTSLLVAAIAMWVLKPGRPRSMADWTLIWMGGTTVRLLLTPLGLFSVYSATLLPGTAVLLGGTAAYLAALAVETTIIGRAVLHPNSLAGSGSSSG